MPSITTLEGDSVPRRIFAAKRGRPRLAFLLLAPILIFAALASPLHAETSRDAWLRYERVDAKISAELYAQFPAVVVSLGDSEVVVAARDEMIRGVRGMLEHTMRSETSLPKERAIILGTFDEVKKALPTLDKLPEVVNDSFWLKSIEAEGQSYLLVTAPNERGVLYGTFALLRKIALAQPITTLNERQSPAAPLRMISQWDRLDGSVGDLLERRFGDERCGPGSRLRAALGVHWNQCDFDQ